MEQITTTFLLIIKTLFTLPLLLAIICGMVNQINNHNEFRLLLSNLFTTTNAVGLLLLWRI
jgi:hypothetical protein